MANDRMYLRCNCCGETILLAKDLGGWHTPISDGKIQEIDDFLDIHGKCNKNLENMDYYIPFELVYEESGTEKDRIIYRLECLLDDADSSKREDIQKAIDVLKNLP